MISLSTITANTAGVVVLEEHPSSEIHRGSARVSRTATLDGGVVLTHSGFAHGDRTLKIEAVISQTQADALWVLHTTETLLVVAVKDGVFYCAIQDLQLDHGDCRITILIKEKLS